MRFTARSVMLALALVGLLVLATVGVVAAQNATATPTPTPTPRPTQEKPRDQVLDRAAAILGVDENALRDALKQASQETARQRQDQAVKAMLDKMVEKGRITQAEADSMYTWWQSRPDVAMGLMQGLHGHKGHHRFDHKHHPHGAMKQSLALEDVPTKDPRLLLVRPFGE